MTNKNGPIERTQADCPLLAGGDDAGRLLDYANRKLSPEVSSRFDLHTATCSSCQAFVASQRSVWMALDGWEPAEMSSDFDRRLWARIEHEQSAPWYRHVWNRMTDFGQTNWRPVVPVAAVLVLAAGLWLKPFNGVQPSSDGGVRIDAEQLETALEDMEMLRQVSTTETPTVQQM